MGDLRRAGCPPGSVAEHGDQVLLLVVAEVLHEIAAQQKASPEALSQALSMLQLSPEFSLLRMCEC